MAAGSNQASTAGPAVPAAGRGAALCAVAMAVLGCSFPVSQQMAAFPVASAQTIRYAMAAAALLLVLAIARTPRGPAPTRLTARDILLLALMAGVGLAGFNLLLMQALHRADVSVVAAIIGCVPIGLAVAGPLLQRRRPTARAMTAAVVVAAGTAIVHGSGHADATGVLAAIGVLACDVVFSLIAATLTPRLGALKVAAGSCVIAVPMLAAAAWTTGELTAVRQPTSREWAALLFLGLVLTSGAFAAWFRGLALIGAERGGVFAALVPVCATAAAAVSEAAMPSSTQLAGIALVSAGLVYALTVPGRAPTPYPTVSRPGVSVLPRLALAATAR